MVRYSHPDGGFYVIINAHQVSMKMDDGRWEPAVQFKRVVRGPSGAWMYEGKNEFVVSRTHWDERFTKVEDDQHG